MRPKSRATVVRVFSGVCPVRSTSAATSVIAASVVSTSISEMAPTAVVFPTPKPPAITIFTGMGCIGRGCACRPSEGSSVELVQSTDHPLNDLDTTGRVDRRPGDREITAGDQVADQNADDSQMQVQGTGDLDNCMRLLAENNDVANFELQGVGLGSPGEGREYLGLDRKTLVHRPSASSGEHVGRKPGWVQCGPLLGHYALPYDVSNRPQTS